MKRMSGLVGVFVCLCSVAFAGAAFYIETFFDEFKNAAAMKSFTFEQNGVEVTITADFGTLYIEDGVVCPTDPDSGLSVITSVLLDQIQFSGPVYGTASAFLIAARKGQGVFVPIRLTDDSYTGASVSILNSVQGLRVGGMCLSEFRGDEYGR